MSKHEHENGPTISKRLVVYHIDRFNILVQRNGSTKDKALKRRTKKEQLMQWGVNFDTNGFAIYPPQLLVPGSPFNFDISIHKHYYPSDQFKDWFQQKFSFSLPLNWRIFRIEKVVKEVEKAVPTVVGWTINPHAGEINFVFFDGSGFLECCESRIRNDSVQKQITDIKKVLRGLPKLSPTVDLSF